MNTIDHHARIISALEAKGAERTIELAAAKDENRRLSSELADAHAELASLGVERNTIVGNRELQLARAALANISGALHDCFPTLDVPEDPCFYGRALREGAAAVTKERDDLQRQIHAEARSHSETRRDLERMTKERDAIQWQARRAAELLVEMGELRNQQADERADAYDEGRRVGEEYGRDMANREDEHAAERAEAETTRLARELRGLRERMEALAARWERDARYVFLARPIREALAASTQPPADPAPVGCCTCGATILVTDETVRTPRGIAHADHGEPAHGGAPTPNYDKPCPMLGCEKNNAHEGECMDTKQPQVEPDPNARSITDPVAAPTGGPDVARALEKWDGIAFKWSKPASDLLRGCLHDIRAALTQPPAPTEVSPWCPLHGTEPVECVCDESELPGDAENEARHRRHATFGASGTPPAARDESVPPPGWYPYKSDGQWAGWSRNAMSVGTLRSAWAQHDAEHSAATQSIPPLPAGWTERVWEEGTQYISRARPSFPFVFVGIDHSVNVKDATDAETLAVLQHHIAREGARDGAT